MAGLSLSFATAFFNVSLDKLMFKSNAKNPLESKEDNFVKSYTRLKAMANCV